MGTYNLDGATAVATFSFAGPNPGDEVTYNVTVTTVDGDSETSTGTLPESAATLLATIIAVETSPANSDQALSV